MSDQFLLSVDQGGRMRLLMIMTVLSGCTQLPYLNHDRYLHTEHADAHHYYSVRPLIPLVARAQPAEPWEGPREKLEAVAEITVTSSKEAVATTFLIRNSEHFNEVADVARRLGGEYFMVVGSRHPAEGPWIVDVLALRSAPTP